MTPRKSPWILHWIFASAAVGLAFLPVEAGIKIHLTGNSFLGDTRLEEALSPEPEGYSEDELRDWREDADFNIADLYRESGFFDAQIKTVLRKRSEDYKDWEATISIEEGT